ncbi:DUF2157 domain-containing protein [Nocardioides donggukensis]|uniref:DUF2157 domain-containing protein n=1 Tax=Nocardioides donggukensis TaxID=2774019 RepID=A0A927K1J6_9ACTN|nr:DUF2157 domain-containing protein [Nocardioides donggukensis]MBD8868404.1 DUF2157 domain-containing protein [Nocardioides donggukensis]
MTTDIAPGPAHMPASGPSRHQRAATPAQLAWLGTETADWTAQGLLRPDQAEAILGHYRATRRFSLGRLLLTLGGVFVGVGLIWLVAANLETLPPSARFAVVTAIWLALVAAAHLGAERRRTRGRHGPSPLVGTGRLLAALAFGAVVFQAAQSLQVPAYEPLLIGVWSAGALVYAYAVRAVTPLLVGLVTGVAWVLWQTVEAAPSELAVVVTLLAVAAGASAVSVLHTRFGPAGFTAAWREAGALLLLVGLFAAAVPSLTADGFVVTPPLVLLGLVAVALAAAATYLGRDTTRLEPPVVLAVAAVAVGLVAWEPSQAAVSGTGSLPVGDWAQAALSVAAYVAVATWVAVLGIWRDSGRLTFLALAALVVFTVFQSFAVFARIFDGAWLFLALGMVLFGAGFLFDRGRRQLEASLAGADR